MQIESVIIDLCGPDDVVLSTDAPVTPSIVAALRAQFTGDRFGPLAAMSPNPPEIQRDVAKPAWWEITHVSSSNGRALIRVSIGCLTTAGSKAYYRPEPSVVSWLQDALALIDVAKIQDDHVKEMGEWARRAGLLPG